jgi:histidinol dehydrogenase
MIPIYQGEDALRWARSLDKPGPAQPAQADERVRDAVAQILAQVAEEGDAALVRIAARLQDPPPETIPADDPRVAAAASRLPPERRAVLDRAAENIRRFAEAVMERVRPPITVQGGACTTGLRFQPVDRAACYVPGGRYPLPSTALMTAVTAQVAGVPEIALFTPRPHDEILYAGRLAGVMRYHVLGGAQAVAAAALGTASIPAVDLIVGPGNAYVTEAKRQVMGRVGIDMLAGPSEVAVLADEEADPRWVALDLLAQAEHDPDARAYLLTDSPALCARVAALLPDLVRELRLPAFITEALAGGALVALPDLAACTEASDRIAPEHLQLHLRDPEAALGRLSHYGAVFVGDAATVPFGDYMAGPNHTLPTRRTARFMGALTPLCFLRAQSFVRAGADVASLARDTARFAEMEGLSAHAAAALARA